jgi:5-methylcytosine-specific restriction endonuclease McrBC GTP-binding regulatory subunit McrB
MYKTVLPVCEILQDIESEDSKNKIRAFIAIYAKARDWLTNKERRDYYDTAVSTLQQKEDVDEALVVNDLLIQRKFVILTGAPGVGKTRLAKIIGDKLDAQVFFTQFHAETNYSDFIYGINPDLDTSGLKYTHKMGTFHQALDFALHNPDKPTLLIVDEINRANLANILGPIFYLFEYQMDENLNAPKIEISPKLSISKLPENFYMIGTMNTADRSLAVVDFALRRRFAWYELLPSPIKNNPHFYTKDFQDMSDVFYWYADSTVLTLQPGQGYFLAENDADFLNRVKYELYPLIKEYLQEQLLISAKEEFNNYFLTRINKPLFQ